VVDISDPRKLRRLGGRDLAETRRLAVCGRYAYVGGSPSTLEVFDVEDPADVRRVGGNSALFATEVCVEEQRLYAATRCSGLAILHLFRPPEFGPLGRSDLAGLRLSLVGTGGRALRLQRSGDLRVWEDWIDVTATGEAQAVFDPNATSQPRQFYRAVMW